MPVFEELFMASNGRPILYRDKTLVLSDRLLVEDGTMWRITFERSAGEWRQGIRLRMLDGGSFVVDGKEITGKQGIVFWADTAPKVVHITVQTNRGGSENMLVYNVWDVGDGVTEVGHNGAAMLVEEIDHGRRYHCNDGHPDDDLDDLVFRIERMLPNA